MSDQSTLLLEHHLKELKLPTFLREYGKLAAQCAAEGVSHPDYLLRLAKWNSPIATSVWSSAGSAPQDFPPPRDWTPLTSPPSR